MKNTFPLTSLAFFTTLFIGGCGALTETDYARPEIATPAAWQNSDIKTPVAYSPWWQQFHDDTLNRLVDEALAKNNDLAAATLKVKAARLNANLALDQFLPDLSATGTASNSQNLRSPQTTSRTYNATANASYEVDLWGKLASQKNAADWEALATEQDRESTAIALVGTTANLYWKIAYLNERIALSQDSIDYLKKTLALVKIQHSTGFVSAIDEASAKQTLATQEAAHTQFVQQKIEAANAFAILFNGPPETLKANPTSLPKDALPMLSENTPASLLERRPDLRAAEHRLRESLSDVDATRASYMPSFSLTGSLGSSSTSLSNVLSNPVGTLGAGIALPFLDWFDMRNNVALSETQYEEAVVSFRQTVYSALADVENALSARARDAEQAIKLTQAADQAQQAEKLYAIQYKNGYVALQLWLDAQEKSRTAKAALLDNRYAQLADCITLYKALGGNAAP